MFFIPLIVRKSKNSDFNINFQTPVIMPKHTVPNWSKQYSFKYLVLCCRDSPMIGYILATCTGLLITMEITLYRYYPDQFSDKNLFTPLFWMYAFGALASLIIMAIFETPEMPTGFREYFFTGCHFFSYVFILPLLMWGSSLTSGNTANIILSSSIIAMLAAQYTILKDIHPGHRNWIEVLGVFLVLLGATISSVVEICQGYKGLKE